MANASVIDKFIESLGSIRPELKLSPEKLDKLSVYYENLVEWNKVMNLTAITDEKDVYEKHFLDSLSVKLPVGSSSVENSSVGSGTSGTDSSGIGSSGSNTSGSSAAGTQKLIDVGTGAGFPGLVLAIAYPELQVTLMDSLNKRISFLNDTIQKADIRNVTCVHARAEELARDKNYREQYDMAVSRAVANLSTLSEYCLPFVKKDGFFSSYKGDDTAEEILAAKNAIFLLGGRMDAKEEFTLPGTDYKRTLIYIRKKQTTSAKYPRKAGTPAKNPL